MMTWIITNHYKSPQVYHDMNHHKSEITTNHHKPWHKPPWTMTETSTKHDMNHYKSPQTMTWTIMMTQKELCIKPYGFLVKTMVLVGYFYIFFVFKERCLQGSVLWNFFGNFKQKKRQKHLGFTENNEMAPKFLTQSQT